MLVGLVVGSVLLAAALLSALLFRPNNDTILRHQRALAALCDAERQHPSTAGETTPARACTDHVHILDAAPANRVAARRRSRSSARRPPTRRRRNAAEIAARPTIAQLPVAAYVPTVRVEQ